MSHPSRYRPDIDGLRAVAILGVLLFHAKLGFRGGYAGVDIFFVISGFLITRNIMRELRAGTFSFSAFWERRIRRIVPALAVLCAGLLVAGWFLLVPDDYRSLGKHLLALALCASNVQFYREDSYFNARSEAKPALHTWSLSVEEQFYLIIPVLLWLAFRWQRDRVIPWGLAALAGVSFALAVHTFQRHPSAAFFLLPCRAWELAAGSLLAFAKPIDSGPGRSAASWAGFILTAGGLLLHPGWVRSPAVAVLPPVLGAVLLLWSGAGGSGAMPLPGRLLALRPLVWVGLISYSLYLWHWPLFAFLKHYGLASENPVTRLLLAGAALVPAWLSYRFIETPFRRKNLLPTTRQAFLFGGLTAASLTAAATAVILTRGAENRLPPEVVRIVRDSEPMPFWSELKPSDVPSKLVPFGSSTGTITLFVWGDSHAMAILPAVDAVTRELGIRGFAATHSATVPTVGYYTRSAWGLNERSPAFNRRVLDHILSTAAGPHQVGVLLAARWTRHMPPSRIGAFQRALAGTVDELTRANVSVFILKEVPGFSYSPPKMIVAAALLGRPLENIRQPLAEHRARTATQDLIFARLHQPDLSLIDLAPVYTDPDGLINPLDDGGSLWRDNHHLSVHGSLKAEDTLRQALQSLVPAPESSLR